MDFDDYETLPTNNIATHMTAGAVAGIMEHCVMYPLDSVKTRMQNLSPSPNATYRGVGEALFRMVRQEGALRPVRGMSAVVVGAGPAHALYFSCYEHIKDRLSQKSSHNHLAVGAAGCVATVLHDGVMNPAEVVKQRLQMYNSPYKSCLDCIAKVYNVEGFRAFYRSYTTQLAMNIPFQSIHFMIYEFGQTITNAERRYNPPAHMVSGAVAGAVAAAVTTPLDVCKTLLNTAPQHAQGAGVLNAIRSVYKLGGMSGYFKGMQARVLYQMPSTAICWSMYELFKYLLLKAPTENTSDSSVSTMPLRIIVPQASLAGENMQDIHLIEGKARRHEERPSNAESESWGSSFTPVKSRELPSVGGPSLYGAIALNTVHNADSNLQKGTTLLDMTHG